jgi:hypothetical protein
LSSGATASRSSVGRDVLQRSGSELMGAVLGGFGFAVGLVDVAWAAALQA